MLGLPPYCLPTYPLSSRPQSRYAGLQDFLGQLDTTQLDAEGLEAASDAAAAAAEAAELTSSALGGLSADLSTLFSRTLVPSGPSSQPSTSAITQAAAGLPAPALAGPFDAPQLPGSAPGRSGDFAAASEQAALAASQHDVALLLLEVQRTQQVRPPCAGVPRGTPRQSSAACFGCTACQIQNAACPRFKRRSVTAGLQPIGAAGAGCAAVPP